MKSWNYKEKLILIVGSAMIVVAVFLITKYIFPYVAAFILALLLALFIEKPVNNLSKVLLGRKKIASAIIIFIASIMSVTVVCYLFGVGIHEIKEFFINYEHNMVAAKQSVARICLNLDEWLGITNGCCLNMACRGMDYFTKIVKANPNSSFMARIISLSFPVVVKILAKIGAIIICLVSVIFLSDKIDNLREWKDKTCISEEVNVVLEPLFKLMGIYFKIEFLIFLINSIILVITFLFMGNAYCVLLGILIGIVDVFPLLGTGTILVPWAIFEVLNKRFLPAAVLLALYVITYLVREVMESKFMGDKIGISPFVMFMIIFLGLMLYGIWGVILGPVSYSVAKALILYLKRIIESGTLKNV